MTFSHLFKVLDLALTIVCIWLTHPYFLLTTESTNLLTPVSRQVDQLGPKVAQRDSYSKLGAFTFPLGLRCTAWTEFQSSSAKLILYCVSSGILSSAASSLPSIQTSIS